MSVASRGRRFALLLGPCLLAAAPAAARVPCAADGPPILAGEEGFAPARFPAIDPTASLTLLVAPWVGADADRRAGDPIQRAAPDLWTWSAGGAFTAAATARARLGACGVADRLAWRLIWEPWDPIERARPDASPWGRLVDAEAAWLPYDWWVVAAGIGKIPFARGREQPLGAMALATLPYSTAAIAPDRRFGLSTDIELGLFRFAVGAFEGARDPFGAPGGLLIAARAELEPFGPVGRRTWPEFGAWTDRWRGGTGLSGAALLRDGKPAGFALGADVAMGWRRLALAGEVLYAQGWPLERPDAAAAECSAATAKRPTAGCLGAWLEALALVWRPWLSLAARAEFVAEDLAKSDRQRFVALAGGANLHLFGPSVMLQVTYTRKLHFDRPWADDALLVALTVAR